MLKLAKSITIGLYRENAIAIESVANDSFGGNVYNVTMQITLSIPEFNVMFIVTYYTSPRKESSDSFWMTRSQRSRRRDKSLCSDISKHMMMNDALSVDVKEVFN